MLGGGGVWEESQEASEWGGGVFRLEAEAAAADSAAV